ncbi:MAG: prephenate dehydrogenase [Spirochaetales bacterium]|jgi:prephenate dehydrogenase|nr:prephenate dehydrogenase [Spirochaetales bacterium]
MESNPVTGFIGLGLMGGGFAINLRKAGFTGRFLAFDTDPETLSAAEKDGVIDEGFSSPETMLGQCSLVFLCLAPNAALGFMDAWMPAFKSGALITDIAGIKKPICELIEKTLRADLDFIPGHPMAGTEKSGYAHARDLSFQGRNYILTPLNRNKPENLAFLKDLIRRLGFSRIVETTGGIHDAKIAFTSQLCHVIAASLIDCEADTAITRFGGGSFEDLTRIAILNASLWTELFIENSSELLRQIEKFETSLDKIKSFIAGAEKDKLLKTLTAVRNRRAEMAKQGD